MSIGKTVGGESNNVIAANTADARRVPVGRARVTPLARQTEPKKVDDGSAENHALVPLHQMPLLAVAKASAAEDLETKVDSETYKVLSELPLMRLIAADIFNTLLQRGTIQTLAESDLLCREGDAVKTITILIKGTAKLFFTAGNGRVAHTRWLFAPSNVGACEALSGTTHATSLSLLEKSTVWSIPADEFRRAAAQSPKLMENVLRETTVDLHQSMALARALLFDDTQARLAQLFISLLDKRGLPGREGRMIPLALTQQDFAEALGVDLRSINRVMVDWFASGLVVKSEKRFCVREFEKLAAIAFASRAK